MIPSGGSISESAAVIVPTGLPMKVVLQEHMLSRQEIVCRELPVIIRFHRTYANQRDEQ